MMTLSLRDVTGVAYDTCTCMYPACHKALLRYRSREINDFNIVLFQIYWNKLYLCQYITSVQKWFDKVIAEIKQCSFFESQCMSCLCPCKICVDKST